MAEAAEGRLVELTEERHGLVIGLAYAGPGNLTGRAIYANTCCLLRRKAAQGLVQAAEWAALCGFRLKVLDAYRPPWAQERLWRHLPDPRYVADAETGSCHSRGVAVDLTLVDDQGRDLDMGTPFDAMEEPARHFFPALPPQVQRNRIVLLGIMTQAGFQASDTEWWHYQLPGARSYPMLQDDRVRPAREGSQPGKEG